MDSIDQDTKVTIAYKLSDACLDVNIQDDVKKQTCLHLAVIAGLSELVYCLLQNSADLTITDQVTTLLTINMCDNTFFENERNKIGRSMCLQLR